MPSTKLPKTLQHRWQFEAIGTSWSIETERQLDDKIRAVITQVIDNYDRVYSRFRSDSLVSSIAKTGRGTYQFPSESADLFGLYDAMYDLTNGSVTPLVGGLLEDAGYDAPYSLRPKTLRPVTDWKDVIHVDGTALHVQHPVTLDFGAAGKGQLIDIICEKMSQFTDIYVVDASGDIRIHGIPQTIGLENPSDALRIIGSVELRSGSICASSINRRAWRGWHHVVDPHTKAPVRDVVATWVIAPTALIADGLATALFFVNDIQLRKSFGEEIQTVRLLADGTIEQSSNFVGELYL